MKKILVFLLMLLFFPAIVFANTPWYSTLQGAASDVEQTPPPNGVTIVYNTTDHMWEFSYALVPAGGTTGTCLEKNSNSDYDYSWVTCSGSGSGLTVGTTTIANGTNGYVEYNNNGVLGEEVVSGTVTSVSVATANGFSGTVANASTTPAITMNTSITGILKGNGTAISAATSGTDYQPALSLLAGTYTNNDLCVYASSGTLLNCNLAQSTFLTPTGSAASLTSFPTLNQNTTGTASNLSGTPTLPNGTAATTQSSSDNSTNIATTAYVTTGISNAISGVNPAVAVQAATTAAGDTSGLTYNNGASGVGATFTGTANTAITIDGYTFTAVGQRLLVKNDTQSPSGAFNGIYSLTILQSTLVAPVFTRATDYNQPSDINNTGAIPVVNGTINGTTSWVLTSTVNTVGTDPLTFTQFSLNPTTILTSVAHDATMTGLGTSGSNLGVNLPDLTILNLTGINWQQFSTLSGNNTWQGTQNFVGSVNGVTNWTSLDLLSNAVTTNWQGSQLLKYNGSNFININSNAVGGMTLVATASPSAVSSFTITGLSPATNYLLVLNLIQNTSTGLYSFIFNSDSGSHYSYSNWITTATGSAQTVKSYNGTSTSFGLNNNGTAATIPLYAVVNISGEPGNNNYALFQSNTYTIDTTSNQSIFLTNGEYKGTSSIASFTVTTSAGTMTGTARLYQLN